jgi:hypothetical protein
MGHDYRGPTIREKSWVGLPRSITSLSTNATFLGGVLDFIGPGTLLRFRCNDILMTFNATQQVDDDINLTLGLGIVSTDAAALGATAMPDPLGEPDYPWVWWGNYTLRSQLSSGVNGLGSSVIRIEADSKAMRRVKPQQSLVWIIEASGASGAPVTVVDIGETRVLLGN